MMTDMHGRFVWYELITTDTAAAVEFYREVIGWAAQGAGVEGVDYTLLMANGAAVAGLMALHEEVRNAGGRPGWIGYVAVDDVDSRSAEIGKKGGKVHRAPDDIPGVGRFAIVADPQGAVFALFRGSGSPDDMRSEEHTSELQSLMRISYAVFCLKKKTHTQT